MPALGRGGVRVGVLVGRPVGGEKGVAEWQWWVGAGPVVVLAASIVARPTWSAPGGGVRWWCWWLAARLKWLVWVGSRVVGDAGGQCGRVVRRWVRRWHARTGG
jgi:hypothetical protein